MKNGQEIKSIIETIEKLEEMQMGLKNANDSNLRVHIGSQDWWIPPSACEIFAGSLTRAIAEALKSAKKRYRELSEESLQ